MIDICGQIAENPSAFFDGDAAGPSGVGLDRQSIESHLKVCTYCGSLRPGRAATPKSGQVPPPPERVWGGIEAILRADGLIRD